MSASGGVVVDERNTVASWISEASLLRRVAAVTLCSFGGATSACGTPIARAAACISHQSVGAWTARVVPSTYLALFHHPRNSLSILSFFAIDAHLEHLPRPLARWQNERCRELRLRDDAPRKFQVVDDRGRGIYFEQLQRLLGTAVADADGSQMGYVTAEAAGSTRLGHALMDGLFEEARPARQAVHVVGDSSCYRRWWRSVSSLGVMGKAMRVELMAQMGFARTIERWKAKRRKC